jgi:hypothetical protein
MYIAEAIPTVGIGVITFFVLTDPPDQAKFLTAEERRWLVTTIAAERRATEAVRHIQLTASGFIPPTGELRTTPPNTLRPATCLRANQARSAVGTT